MSFIEGEADKVFDREKVTERRVTRKGKAKPQNKKITSLSLHKNGMPFETLLLSSEK